MSKFSWFFLGATVLVTLGWFGYRSFHQQGIHSDVVLGSKVHDADEDEDEQEKQGEEGEAEEEDGIQQAQEMEINMTKDLALGYVPKFRLIETHEELLRQRQANRGQGADAFTWIERGPNSDVNGPYGNGRVTTGQATAGRMRAIWVDLADNTNKTVWVGGIDGGIWKTTDITVKPSPWSLVTDVTANIAIASIAQSPVNTDVMYFGTGEKTLNADAVRGGGIWKSTDHGATWNLLTSTTGFYNVSKVVCDPNDVNTVYVSTISSVSTGVRRSTDGGATWTTITPIGLNTSVTEMEMSSTGRLHIVCGYYNGYFNSGTSGYRFTDNPATVTTATWTTPTTPFTSTAYNVDIAVAGSTLYALPSNSAYQTPLVWKSTDGGDNWATVTAIPTTTAVSSGQAWYNLAIGVDPTTPNNIMVGGLNSYRSTDGGTTWTLNSIWATGQGSSTNYIHADHHVIVWSADQVLDGGDGGVFYSANDGVAFADRNTGLRIKQFYSVAIHPTSTDYFLAGAQDNGSHQLNAPGLTSSVEVTGGDGAFVHIDQDEPQNQFTSYVYAQYRRSTDGGANWASINFSGSNGSFINPTDYDDGNNRLYGGWTNGSYHRWDNATTSTTNTAVPVAAFNGSAVSYVNVSPYTPNRVFFGTGGGRIVRVDNAQLNTPTGINITGTGMPAGNVTCVAVGTSDNNLLATYSNYGLITNRLWVSTNGGGTAGWTNITGNFPDIPVRWAMFYPEDNTKAILATELGIYTTSFINGASTVWVQETGFPTVRTDMLQYRVRDGLVAAATHGRGIWSTTIPKTIPYIRFASNINAKTEATSATTGCRNYQDYTVAMNIDLAPAGNAAVTLVPGGTATLGQDYDITTNGSFTSPSNVLTFASGATTSQTFTIRIYNDDEVENTENINLSYTIGTGTNAQAAPSSSNYTFTITDNDIAPVPSGAGTATVGAGDYGGYIQPFRSNFSDSKSQFIYLASELTAANISAGNITSVAMNVSSKTSTQAYSGLTISLKNTTSTSYPTVTFETGATVFYTGNYSTFVGVNTFSYTTAPFVWDGTSNVLIEICYDNATATGTGDNVSCNTTADVKGIWNRDVTGSGCSLAAAFNGVGTSYIRPDITFGATLSGNPIATAAATTKTDYIPNNGLYYFYSTNNVLGSLLGASANLGCVSNTILEAGTTWQSFSGGTRSQKLFDVTPATNPGASYTIGLYFTNAELAGRSPATLKLAKTTAATIAAANMSNTFGAATTFAAYGDGWLFTASYAGFGKFFLADQNAALPVTLLSFTGQATASGNMLNWSTSSELNSKQFTVEKSSDGNTYSPIAKVAAAGNSTTRRNYDYLDKQVVEYNYYRLKLEDKDGKSSYSNIVTIINHDVMQAVQVLNNPFNDYIDVRLAKLPKQKVEAVLLSVSGAQLYSGQFGAATNLRINLGNQVPSKGTYILRLMVDGKSYINKVVKQ